LTTNENENAEIMPKRFLQFLGLLVLTVLLSVFTFRIMDFPLVGTSPKAAVAQEISLEFVERNRFDVVVLDKYGKVLAESTDGSNGFLGVVYNAVKRERIKRRVVADNLLRLVQYRNGRISVIDDATGSEIQVNSFGGKNLEVFGLLFNK
jgi:putative photosynthetic complex assembly protein